MTIVSFYLETVLMSHYGSDLTMRDARAAYFRENEFGEDGGYGATWVDFKIGPVPFPFPNTPARVRAVKYHDLHHVLTGYRTDFQGELEISAWEIGAGCGSFFVPWQLNLGGLAGGAFFMPRRIFDAFVRGRRSQSLYGLDFEPLLDRTVGQVREALHVPEGRVRVSAADVLAFAAAVAAGIVVGLLTLAVFLPLAPIGVLAGALRRRQPARA